ncbi:hypothetical protein ACFSC4_31340 [Deinococcus malanensis]|uniref:hypothetical protein n=1 Tax=Deinococcus malanensis TaxID=1706855 RepID=UPI0036293451
MGRKIATDAELEAQILALIGVTGWSLPQIMALTYPQLTRLLAGQGQILYPRLKPQLDEQFSKYSDEPGPKGEESDIDRVLREHSERQAALKAHGKVPQSFKQQRWDAAYRALFSWYLPPLEASAAAGAEAIAGLPPVTAQAILDAARSGLIPMDIYRNDLKPIEPNLLATAAQAS